MGFALLENGLRVRALAAASAARFAGFPEACKALLELAKECERDLPEHAGGCDTMSWCIERAPKLRNTKLGPVGVS